MFVCVSACSVYFGSAVDFSLLRGNGDACGAGEMFIVVYLARVRLSLYFHVEIVQIVRVGRRGFQAAVGKYLEPCRALLAVRICLDD